MSGRLNNEVVGSHTEQEWHELLIAWKWRCYYCARPVSIRSWDAEREASKDHLFPISRGGVDFIWNIVPACIRCNRLKGEMSAEEFFAARPAFSTTVQKQPEQSTGTSLLETREVNTKALPLSGPCLCHGCRLSGWPPVEWDDQA